MVNIDDNVITLIIVVLCIVICFRNSTILYSIIGGFLVTKLFNSKKYKSFLDLSSLKKKKEDVDNLIVTNVNLKESFTSGNKKNNIIPIINLEDIIETEMNIELEKNKAITKIESINTSNAATSSNDTINDSTTHNDLTKLINDINSYNEPIEEINSDIIIDGDESIAYNSIHRNEPTRVIKGMGKAYVNLSKYVREEVEEIEGKEWWGNNDY